MDLEITSLEGIVEERNRGRRIVKVRLLASNLLVEFSEHLFTEDLMKLGRPVDYVIKQKPGGIIYQMFRPRKVKNI